MTNVAQVLEACGVEHITSHPNVSGKCVGVCCPHCNDSNFHLGVYKDRGNFTCWRCGARGSLFDLVHTLTGISYEEFTTKTKGFDKPVIGRGGVLQKLREILQPKQQEVPTEVPPAVPAFAKSVRSFESVHTIPCLLYDFLQERRIKLKTCQQRHCFVLTLNITLWGGHLLVPILGLNGRYLGFQGRDLTGRAKTKYLTPHGFNIKNVLYGLNEASRKHLVITEGVFDAWRVGVHGTCTFGAHLSDAQLVTIAQLKPKRITLVWEANVERHAQQAASRLAAFCSKVFLAQLPEDEDPDSLGPTEVWRLIKKAERVW